MHPTRFDRLAKRLAGRPLSRRAVTKGGAGLAAAALTGGGGAAAQGTPATGTAAANAAAAVGATPAAPAGTGAPVTTAILVAATNAPLRVAGSDGADHLDYDLIVTNAFTAPVTLTAIDVLAPDGTRLLHLAGAALVQATQPLLGATPTAQLPVSGTVAVVMDVVVPHDRALSRLSHRISYTVPPTAPVRTVLEAFTVEAPTLPVDPRPATVLAPPLHGAGWLAANGCCSPDSSHRQTRLAVDGTRLAKIEMFAVDFILLRNGQLFTGNGNALTDWYDFGSEVVAVADGTVVSVRDDMPEGTPNIPANSASEVKGPADYDGNHVILALKPGVYANYAHLQPGSITVKVGEHVTAGQVLGKLGDTGNATAPHLHFGLLDNPDPLTGTSLPMVFDRYTVAGTVNTAAASSTLQVVGPPQAQTATLPLFGAVADFR